MSHLEDGQEEETVDESIERVLVPMVSVVKVNAWAPSHREQS